MVQFVEQSLPQFNCIENTKIKKKRPGMAHLKNSVGYPCSTDASNCICHYYYTVSVQMCLTYSESLLSVLLILKYLSRIRTSLVLSFRHVTPPLLWHRFKRSFSRVKISRLFQKN